MFRGGYILGGIESRSLEGLVTALLKDAADADSAPPASERSRHVNTRELQEIAHRLLRTDAPLGDARAQEKTEMHKAESLPGTPGPADSQGHAPIAPTVKRLDLSELLPYERFDESALLKAIMLGTGERMLVLRPFGWHIDGSHIPNAAEHFSREYVCAEHGWDVVCDYGPYVAIVKAALGGGDPR